MEGQSEFKYRAQRRTKARCSNPGAGTGSGSTATVIISAVGTELYNGTPVAVHVIVYPDRDIAYSMIWGFF